MTFEDISIFLKPTSLSEQSYSDDSLGSKVSFFSGNHYEPTDFIETLVVIGVSEERGNPANLGTAEAPDKIREYLYALKTGGYERTILDLGNITAGFEKQDTYFAITKVVNYLLKSKAVLLVMGGSQDLTYPIYLAYEKLEQTVNLVSIDSRFDIGEIDSDTQSNNFLGKIVMHEPNYLFNYSNLAYQSYFVDQKSLELMQKLYFDIFRLGEIKEEIAQTEAILRNADIVSFDMSSIRFADAPGCLQSSPNGLNGEDACRISRYSGISDKLSVFGIFELNPKADNRNQTAFLAAEMAWYFLNGYFNRVSDYPIVDKSAYSLFTVPISDGKYTIEFYKSNKSDRWWMEVPYPSKPESKYERQYMIPCSYSDYQLACNDEIPDRWWKTYQKLH